MPLSISFTSSNSHSSSFIVIFLLYLEVERFFFTNNQVNFIKQQAETSHNS